jgi:4-diphosphocytidyl-2-C-methyl-D-erythritol kinase
MSTEEWHSGPLRVRAPAKINLGLEVLGRRSDGLHEICTVLQTISLGDRLEISLASGIALGCRGMLAEPDNLILRAANLFRARSGARAGCHIICEKRIPLGSGLGGGSADAAATLRALNYLWGTGWTLSDLEELAAEIGADVPFCVRGGTAIGSGSGRTIRSLPPTPGLWVVLVPLASASTAKTGEMYGALEKRDFSDGSRTRRLSLAIEGGEIDPTALVSSFDRSARARWPETALALDVLLGTRCLAATVSGAGPSVFALYRSRGEALDGLWTTRRLGLGSTLRRFVPGILAPERRSGAPGLA